MSPGCLRASSWRTVSKYKPPWKSELVQDSLLQLDAYKPMGDILGFNPGYSKSWLMSSDLSQLVFKLLVNLERQMSSQFLIGARKKTLLITGLSVLLQYVVNLWRRLF